MRARIVLVIGALLFVPLAFVQSGTIYPQGFPVGESRPPSEWGGSLLSGEGLTVNPSGEVYVDEVSDHFIGGSPPRSKMGYRMAKGDFNGDGELDLAIAAVEDSTLSQNGGAVHLYLGPLPGEGFDLNTTPPDLTIYGGIGGGKIGESMIFEDLSGDGKDELIIGAPSTIYPISLWIAVGGAVYIIRGEDPQHYGGRVDLPLIPRASGDVYDVEIRQGGDVICIWGLGPQENVFTGYDLAAGDLNGDGLGDLVLSRHGSSSVHIFWGSSAWPSVNVLNVTSDYEDFGKSVLVMDVDSDGYGDLVVGAPGYSPPGKEDAGGVFIFFGNSTLGELTELDSGAANVTVEGTEAGMRLGEDLCRLRVSDSGYDTIAVSAPGELSGGEEVGSVYLIRGRDRGYFEREQPVSELYFLKVVGDGVDAPLARLKGYDADGDGRDELVLLRPTKKVRGVMRGELVVIYSASIYGSGPKERGLGSLESYVIFGEDDYDAFGCDALYLNGFMYVGAYGADGRGGGAVDSGGIYLIETSYLRISEVRVEGAFHRGGVLYVAPYRDFRVLVRLYSARGVDSIGGIVLNFSESEGWDDYVEVMWDVEGGLSEVRDPYELLDIGLSGEIQSTVREITVTFRMWLSYLWPTRGNISGDISLLGAGGGGVIGKGMLEVRLLKEVEWRYEGLYVYSGMRNVSMDGMYIQPFSPLSFRGPDIVYREYREVPVDLRYFRALLRCPDREPLLSSLQGGFTVTTEAPGEESPEEGYRYSVEVTWVGPAPPEGWEWLSLPAMPLPLEWRVRVVSGVPEAPENVSIEGEWGRGYEAYSRAGEFDVSWSEEWLEPGEGELPVSLVKVRAEGVSYTEEFMGMEGGGLSCIVYNGSDFSGDYIYMREVRLPVRWGVLGPEPVVIDPEEFSGIFYGGVLAEETGTYTVGLVTDTVGILDLDGKTMVVSEGGEKRTAMVTLGRGVHTVRIWYRHMGEGECYVGLYFYPSYRPEEYAREEVQLHPSSGIGIELDQGVWNVSVRGVDLLGVEGEPVSVRGVVDRTPPGIVRLPGPSWYSTRPQRLEFEVSDEGAGVDILSLEWSQSLGGGEWGEYTGEGIEVEEVEGGGRRYHVNLSVSFPDGESNYVRLRVKDRVGNGYTYSGSLQVKVDTLPPEVEILSPVSGEEFDAGSVRVEIRMEDTLSGLDPSGLEVYVEGEGWRGVAGDFARGEKEVEMSIVLSLREGNNTIRVAVRDLAGNRAESEPLVIVRVSSPENHPPVAIIDSPANGSRHQQGYLIVFDGRSSYDDGIGPYGGLHYLWTSNISGVLGEGALIERSLPAGYHLITLYVDDGEYNVSAHVEIEVVAPGPPPYTPPGGGGGGGGEGGLRDIGVGILVLLGVIIFIVAVWFYTRYQGMPEEQAVIPIGPEEE